MDDYDVKSPGPSEAQDPNIKKLGCGVALHMAYIKSREGILLAVITIVSLVAMIINQATAENSYSECVWYHFSAYRFYGFVSGSAFLTGLINYIIYALAFYKSRVLKCFPWHVFWLIYSSVWTLLYLVCSVVEVACACGLGGFFTAAFVGFFCMVLFGIQAYMSFVEFRDWKNRGTSDHDHGAPISEYDKDADF